MRIFICDICGEHFKEIEHLDVGGKQCRMTHIATYLDICPDCTDAIQKVIDERKELKK